MRIDNAILSGSVFGSSAVVSITGSFTGSGHITTSSYAVTTSYALNGGSGGGGSDVYSSIYVTADTTAITNRLYVFTSSTLKTLTLPASPTNGDSLYISNRSDISTNIVARNNQLIMGLAQDVTLDVAPASFKLTYAAGTQGWVITGAGGAGASTNNYNYAPTTQTANFTAVSGKAYIITSSASPITMSLPPSPGNGDSIKFAGMDGKETHIAANGNKIMSGTEDLTVNVTASFELIYESSLIGWTVIGSRSV